MLISKVKKYAQSLLDGGKSIDEVKQLVDEFIGDEDIVNEDNEVVKFNLKVKEVEEAKNEDIELEVKRQVAKVVKENTPKVKARIFQPERIENVRTVPAQCKKLGPLTCYANEEDAYEVGRWWFASMGHKQSQNWCSQRNIGFENLLTKQNTQVEGTNALGGFLVPTLLTAEVIKLMNTYSVAIRNARIFPMSTRAHNVPKLAQQLRMLFHDESATKTQDDKRYEQINLVAKKTAVIVRISEELNEDSIIPIVEEITTNIAEAAGYTMDWAAFVAPGNNDAFDGGITGLAPAVQTNSDNVINASALGFNSIPINDITRLMSILPVYAQPNAKFYCSKYFYNRCMTRLLVTGGGNTIVTLQTGEQKPGFIGTQVEFTEVMEGANLDENPSVSGPVLLYGDMRKSTIIGMRKELEIKVSSEAGTLWERDEIGIRARMRFDIQNHGITSVDPQGTGTSGAGPMVCLVSPAGE